MPHSWHTHGLLAASTYREKLLREKASIVFFFWISRKGWFCYCHLFKIESKFLITSCIWRFLASSARLLQTSSILRRLNLLVLLYIQVPRESLGPLLVKSSAKLSLPFSLLVDQVTQHHVIKAQWTILHQKYFWKNPKEPVYTLYRNPMIFITNS